MMFHHFDNITLPDKLFSGIAMCNHCGRLVETGAINLPAHLDACAEYQAKIPVIDFSAKGQFQQILKLFNKKNGTN